MLPAYSHRHEGATSSCHPEADCGSVYRHGDRNYNYSSKKRPAVTISSSQPQAFRKKKVGFDAEQCGFLRINDIILTISGNMNKTYEQMSLNSDRTAFIKELAFAKIQSQENRVNWKELKKLNTSKDKRNGYVSEALSNYLRGSERSETKKECINKQLLDLDIILRDDTSCLSFFSDASSMNVSEKPAPVPGRTGLWTDLKKKGFKEVKHSKSLFEMLVPESAKPDYNDIRTRRKSATENDLYDNELESSVDTTNVHSRVSEASTCEQKSDMVKRQSKKVVTIREHDGTIHSPSAQRSAKNDNERTADSPVPSIVITPPSSICLAPSTGNSIASSMQENEAAQALQSFSLASRRSGITHLRAIPETIAPTANIYQTTKDISEASVSSNNSCTSAASRYVNSRIRHKDGTHNVHPVRLLSSSTATRQTGTHYFNVSNNSVETDTDLTQWDLHQATESLRRETRRLKRKILQWTRASEQKTCDPASVYYEQLWRLITMFSYLTMVIIGILLGKYVI